ncbi:HNH endonuclease [Candidatus Woesearchaeota archaeon]|nr:HNH endonuclease [Candidatus Woesearchaeota archaeon]
MPVFTQYKATKKSRIDGLVNYVRTELGEYRSGSLDNLLTCNELGAVFGISSGYASLLIQRNFSLADKNYRIGIVELQRGRRVSASKTGIKKSRQSVERTSKTKLKNLLIKLDGLKPYILDELRAYKGGRIQFLSSNDELASLYGVTHTTIRKISRRILNKKDSSLRDKILRENTRRKISISRSSYNEEGRKLLISEVKRELFLYSSGKSFAVSSSEELAEKFGISSQTVYLWMKEDLPDSEIRSRNQYLVQSRKLRLTEQRRIIHEDIIDFIKKEIVAHREGKISRVTGTTKLMSKFGITQGRLSFIIDENLTKDDIAYRISAMNKQRADDFTAARTKENLLDFLDYVSDEIRRHRSGDLPRLTFATQLGEEFDICGTAASYRLRKYLDRQDFDYWLNIVKQQKLSDMASLKGEKHPMFGKKHSQETRLKISNANSKKEGFPQCIDFVKAEIELHKYGNISKFSSIGSLGEKFGICGHTILKWLKKGLSKEELDYRRDVTRSQVGVRGANHYLFNGHMRLKYSVFFTDVMRSYIRARDNFECQLCGATEGRRAHHVHHIDYNKKNDGEMNLILLCGRCHPSIGSSLIYLGEVWNFLCNKRIEDIYEDMFEERFRDLQQFKFDLMVINGLEGLLDQHFD